MYANEDVVCPDCGAEIVYRQEPDDIMGTPGEVTPVDCANTRCSEKDMMWAPIPRSEYRPR